MAFCACNCGGTVTGIRADTKQPVRFIMGHWRSTLGKVFSPLPTAHASSLELAWAAGVFEGEGSCGRTGQRGRSTVVHVAQKERWLLDRLAAFFGGRVGFYKNGIQKDGSTKYYYRWFISGVLARGFLMTIYQFLSPHKKKQTRVALGLA